MALCWGIAGIGKISSDFYIALTTNFTDGKHTVVAIASRDIKRCKEFQKIHPVKRIYDSYEKLSKDSNVEVVYIANLNNLHFDVALMMLNNGKHVLCEQPMGINFWQTKQLINLAKLRNLFIMEGISSRFFPPYNELKSLISSKESCVEIVKEIYVHHGYKGNDNCPCIMDIAIYPIQFVCFVFGSEQPKSINASGEINLNGFGNFFEAKLSFSGGRFAKIVCSDLKTLESQATVITKKGSVCIPNYWCPKSLFNFDSEWKEWNLPTLPTSVSMNYTNSIGLRYEADEVQKCIRLGRLSSDILPPQEILLIAQIRDEIRRQIMRHDCH